MSGLGEALTSLARVFRAQKLRWYVFGAQAVTLRGNPRATQDLDVTVDCPRDERGALLDQLAHSGLRHRFPEMAEELLEDGHVAPLIHQSGFEVDLVFANTGLESLAFDGATELLIDGVPAPVASAADLIIMKLIAGRGKDIEDVQSLLASADPDLAYVREILTQVEQALEIWDLLPKLEAALAANQSP